ncbi:MAG TPA: GNAT family N-acetyltransferase [Candidatus Binataceae bacterium]|nr:GNAT family N-acetyltransferase [Candidatus Binataceae bacterium]
MTNDIAILEPDLSDPAHAAALIELFDLYMRDPMEGGAPIPAEVRRKLVPGLRAHPACHVFMAYHRSDPVGFAICFLGFSTFNARPLINIHDISVIEAMRGRGVGAALLARIEARARALDCCRITLEVREDNQIARGLYRKFGFAESAIGNVRQEFWVKPLR